MNACIESRLADSFLDPDFYVESSRPTKQASDRANISSSLVDNGNKGSRTGSWYPKQLAHSVRLVHI